ncbi:SHQ1 protein-domain-containing protein [Fimicolochytrium jonesii]|uniref:SHQ1 protein-domain-containing protein n=1 Tax=Fimicolochytrium jonesii TaxID=1396493 RepID=UPI0022FF2C8F|nr:SHQ1 protein-domain-containing protein [Fimicolochytrium jonesii]KAI8822541.1 SHQ1 protein-domain-containing protein [Fimicolochytrium jonesii]
MLTPAFTISQDDEFVTVVLKCPYVKAQDVEFYISDTEFKFYISPYFLRLNLPASVVENGRETAAYDVDKGEVTVKIPKATPGEHFPDLDLLTKLLAPKGPLPPGLGEGTGISGGQAASVSTNDAPRSLIQVVGDIPASDQDGDAMDEGDEEDGQNYHWDLPQTLPIEPELRITNRYGFNNAYSGIGDHIREIAQEIIQISNVDESTAQSRREERIAQEDLKFDEEHYIADYLNKDEIDPLIQFKPESWKVLKRIQTQRRLAEAAKVETANVGSIPSSDPSLTEKWLAFSEQEQEQMRNLPNKEYLLDDERAAYLGLVDLVFAYSYNHRTTEGENTVESPWTIAILSATLSSFETFGTLRETLIASVRRSLAFPLYRSFALATRCIEDTAAMFKLGKRALLKAVLQIQSLVGSDDRMYILRKIWIDDYAVWIQQASERKIQSLASELNHISLKKDEIGWDLEKLEQLANDMPPEDADPEGPQMML